MQIGKYNLNLLEDIKNLYLYDFGIFLELAPDEEEKMMLEANIQMALSKEDINLEDALDIRELHNLKQANQLLKLKRKQKVEREQKQQMEMQAMQAEQQQAAIMAQSQAEQQKKLMEMENAMQLKQAEIGMEIEKMNNEAMLKSQLMEKEFAFNMQLKGIEQSQIDQREAAKEKGKSERITMANSQQSRLIEQRKRNLPPITFESNEDTLDGFDLAQFGPK
jgi:hypothetical protein